MEDEIPLIEKSGKSMKLLEVAFCVCLTFVDSNETERAIE